MCTDELGYAPFSSLLDRSMEASLAAGDRYMTPHLRTGGLKLKQPRASQRVAELQLGVATNTQPLSARSRQAAGGSAMDALVREKGGARAGRPGRASAK